MTDTLSPFEGKFYNLRKPESELVGRLMLLSFAVEGARRTWNDSKTSMDEALLYHLFTELSDLTGQLLDHFSKPPA